MSIMHKLLTFFLSLTKQVQRTWNKYFIARNGQLLVLQRNVSRSCEKTVLRLKKKKSKSEFNLELKVTFCILKCNVDKRCPVTNSQCEKAVSFKINTPSLKRKQQNHTSTFKLQSG